MIKITVYADEEDEYGGESRYTCGDVYRCLNYDGNWVSVGSIGLSRHEYKELVKALNSTLKRIKDDAYNAYGENFDEARLIPTYNIDGNIRFYTCSNCGAIVGHLSKYCEDCGAKLNNE